MPSSTAQPSLDPEFDPMAVLGDRDRTLTGFAWVESLRAESTERTPDEAIASRPLAHEQFEISGNESGPVMSLFRREELAGVALPCIYLIHGGGFVSGTRFSDLGRFLDWVVRFPVAVASIEYRLAPEFPHPAAFDDCNQGLEWLSRHATELNLDTDRLIIAGSSAGGGLAAAVAISARDRGGPRAIALLLMSPMLDHRNSSISAVQFSAAGNWTARDNEQAWDALLPQRGFAPPSFSASSSLATRLFGLPPTYIDVGSAEVFRDEDVGFATRIWMAGGRVELHVWEGGFHCFDLVHPQAALSRRAWNSRDSWLARVLGLEFPAASTTSAATDAH